MVGDCHRHSNSGITEFSILREVRRGDRRTATLDFQRADFGLFRGLVDRVPWERVLKGRGFQEDWTFFKKETLKLQEQVVPMCQKMSRQGRRPAWLNRELCRNSGKRERVYDLRRDRQPRRTTGML